MLFHLSNKIIFPNPSLADEDGLLAIGGDLSEERLLAAYTLGIFPWYSKGEPILWYSPQQRFILKCDEIHISYSMQKLIRSNKYAIRWDTAFEEVIINCATIHRKGQRGTWIHKEMIAAYTNLHQKGHAQSVEIWQEDKLVGGIYGVVVGKVFCGESMFSKAPSASKLALIAICQSGKFSMIDCQMHSPHLETMGGKFISADEFRQQLSKVGN